MTVEVVRARSDEDLLGIFKLHQENLVTNLSEEEKRVEGFVTAVYDLPLLQTMHSLQPAVIAKDGDRVVGYVLVVSKAYRGKHQLLDELMDAVDLLEYNGRSLADTEYALCGQLCVAKGYRGQGLVQKLYQLFRDDLHDQFNYCITDVASSNPRSLKAHEKCGFKVINSTSYDGVVFDIILWDWTVESL